MTPERLHHYKINIQSIDEDHAEIFRMIDALILANGNIVDFQEIVKPLIQLLHDHFIFEEDLMISFKYPYLEYHFKSHMDILRFAENIEMHVEHYHNFMLDELAEKMVKHIDDFDFQFSNFMEIQSTLNKN